jgi:hypothetical protein
MEDRVMRKQAILVVLSAVMISFFAAGAARAASDFEKQFGQPGIKYGSAPFWSWNEKLEKGEMIRQLNEFKRGGVGGTFIHARVGLITPYMSKAWLDGVKLSVEHDKKIGLLTYLYDEDRWPSGYASGITTKRNPGLRQKGLYMLETDKPLAASDLKPDWKIVRVFAVNKYLSRLGSYQDVTPKSGIEINAKYSQKTLLYFIRVVAKRTEWFNNESYVDTMDPKAIKSFLDNTYEGYKKAVGNEFGKNVPAIFTDEPCYLEYGDFPRGTVPWNDFFAATFKKKYGYDIEKYLPLLYFDTANAKDSMKVRLNFWTNATEMFREAFGHQIYDWCEKNNIEFTGHYMCEDNLVSQIHYIGAAMPLYEYQQRPGIDHLGRNINDLLTAKQVSSVAHQFNRPFVLTEIYGCDGWNLSFDNMKWIADWHYALGVNFMNEHLAWYTARGERKRDYPCCISYQSPWWRYFKIFGNYLTRMTFFTSQGEYKADTLVLHPSTSAWAIYSSVNEGPTQILNKQLTSLIEAMSGAQVDYDLGDEMIIARHGRVKGGKFIVKGMAYSSVVIPPGTTIRATTANLLKQFIAGGGKVIMVAPAPTYVDATKPLELKGAISAADNNDAIAKLIPFLPRHVAVTEIKSGGDTAGTGAIYIHQRKIGGNDFVFFANTNGDKGVDVTAVMPYTGRVRSWDLFTGKEADYPAKPGKKSTEALIHLEPSGSVLLSLNPREKYVAPKSPALRPENLTRLRGDNIADNWKIVSSDLNAITLDYMRYKREGDADWSTPVENYMVQEALSGKPNGTKFQVRYSFNLAADPKDLKQLFFVMEQPFAYQLTLNGKEIKYTDIGWWRDTSFKKIDIKDAAVQGRNILEASGKFINPTQPGTMLYVDGGIEVESAYVIGDFAVKPAQSGGYELRLPTDTVKYGNLVKQGFPFFSGSIVIGQDVQVQTAPGEKVFLELDGLYSITTKVTVNGKNAGLIAFHPHSLNITPFVKNGTNRIEIEMTDSNRNLMGPLHGMQDDPTSVGPGSFREALTKKYSFLPFGISKSAQVVYYK